MANNTWLVLLLLFEIIVFSFLDQFIVGNVGLAHFLCLSMLESGKLYVAW